MTHLFPRGNLTEARRWRRSRPRSTKPSPSSEIQLIIDMVSVALINSKGLETLFDLRQKLVKNGGWLKVTNAKPLIRDIFRVTGLDQVIDIVNSFNIDKHEVEKPAPRPGIDPHRRPAGQQGIDHAGKGRRSDRAAERRAASASARSSSARAGSARTCS